VIYAIDSEKDGRLFCISVFDFKTLHPNPPFLSSELLHPITAHTHPIMHVIIVYVEYFLFHLLNLLADVPFMGRRGPRHMLRRRIFSLIFGNFGEFVTSAPGDRWLSW
jgi:hypothetical protein